MKVHELIRSILWHSNAPFVPTGYGNQTGIFVPRLADLEIKMTVSAFHGLNGSPLVLDKYRVLPGNKDPWGNDILIAHTQHYQPTIVLGLLDHWVIRPEVVTTLGNYVAWAPVDHDPAPPPTVNVLSRAFAVIAYSRFGEKALKEAGLNPYYVPHGIDGEAFALRDKAECRKLLNFPKDAFVVGIVAANKGNPSRKSFEDQIFAFSEFQRWHPDALLYIHTDMEGYQGVNIGQLLEMAGANLDRVMICGQYEYQAGLFTTAYMRDMYNAMDVLMNCAQGEGFGIPIMEAQFCGTPVMTTDFTAMPELTVTGWKIPVARKWITPQGSYQAFPDREAMVAALEEAYKKKGEHDREATRAAVQDYEADNVVKKYWIPVLKAIGKRVQAAKQIIAPVVIAPRDKSATNGKTKAPATKKAAKRQKPVVMPNVSVIMPVYNMKDSIGKALGSIPKEVTKELTCEVIVVDDCSDDGTWKALREWRDVFGDRLQTFRRTTGGGPVEAFNTAIPHIRGKYAIKLDADDWLHEGGLAALVAALERNPAVGFAYGQCQYEGDQHQLYVPPPFSESGFDSANRAIGEPMYRASAHSDHGLKHRGFYEVDGRWYGPHDWDFLLQLIHTLGWKGIALPDDLIHHYTSRANGSASAQTRAQNANGQIMVKFRSYWPQLQGVKI